MRARVNVRHCMIPEREADRSKQKKREPNLLTLAWVILQKSLLVILFRLSYCTCIPLRD
jgi:hypothetical protein